MSGASTTVRPATPVDFARIAEIAAEGDSHDAGASYLAFVAAQGRLLAAEHDGRVVAFGGMVPIGAVAMVTDLFVAADARGDGVGGRVLAALLDGRSQRMTCSSQHAAALPVYRRGGMEPVDRLLYLDGVAAGGGALLLHRPWRYDRRELVDHFAEEGALVAGDVVVHSTADGATVLRLQHETPSLRLGEVLAALPAGTPVRAHVRESNPVAAELIAAGFTVTDHDLICASPEAMIPSACSCVHAGLF
ncbi:MAG: GNAT family N-acetyltransferase [Ilumatobacteraceae bacterium]